MLELGAGADILRGLGWLYIGLIVVLVGVALWFPERGSQKVVSVIVVLLIFMGPAYFRNREREQLDDERKARYENAKALFAERCKTAGERIYRTVDNVEGIQLLTVRQYDVAQSDPMMIGAAAAHESYGDFYIRSFLLYEREATAARARSLVEDNTVTSIPGYRYVDVVDPKDQKRYRYTLDGDMQVKREEARDAKPRYAVTFDDIVDPKDREYWVAGSVLKVVDLESRETLGEFTRYVLEPGQGSRAGQRTPWLFAQGCGMKTSYGGDSPRLFVDQVLRPAKGSLK